MKKSSVLLGSVMGLALTVSGVYAAVAGFSDVPADHWAAKAVEWAKTAGLVEGYQDGTFKGNNNITRYENLQVLSKYDGMLDKEMAAMTTKMDTLQKQVTDLQKLVDANYFPVVTDVDQYYGVLHVGTPIRYICESKVDGTRIYHHTLLTAPFEEKYYDAQGNPINGAVETTNCQATTIEYYDAHIKA